MAGIYIHIPYCRHACHYCDFHFSTSTRNRTAMWEALLKEMQMRKEEWRFGPALHLYFGGGTPSLLPPKVLQQLIASAREHYGLVSEAECTLEVNPDDVSPESIDGWKAAGINRLSIGIQSFHQEDLRWMNRAHDAEQAQRSLELASGSFDNYSVDLIYGLPHAKPGNWESNVRRILDQKVPHLSAYALTVEEHTVLDTRIRKGQETPVSDESARADFEWLVEVMEGRGYDNYELSNFALPGFYSKNNSAYWQGKPYVGIGPSAHSFDGYRRSWNVRSNPIYIREIGDGRVPREEEVLSKRDRYNEYVMTRLRTRWGVSLQELEESFGPTARDYLKERADRYVREHLLFYDGERLLATRKGRFLVDGIASDLFLLNIKG